MAGNLAGIIANLSAMLEYLTSKTINKEELGGNVRLLHICL